MTTSALYLSFPEGYVKDEDLSTAIQLCFNSVESIDFFIRRFWAQIMSNETLKTEIIHYALFWSDRSVPNFYHFNDLLKPNLDLVIDKTNSWTFSYEMTNLQYDMFCFNKSDKPGQITALLLANGAKPTLDGPTKPSSVALNLSSNKDKFNAIVADLNNLPRDEFLKKYDIEDKRSPKAKDINGFEFNKLLPEIKEIVITMVIDREFEWLRLVCKEWRDLTMKILRAKVPRVPKKFIGKFELNDTTVKNSLEVLEIDEVSLNIFRNRILLPIKQPFENILPDFTDIPSFAGDEFKTFILDYYNSGCKYVTCMSLTTGVMKKETEEILFICKAASFGVLIVKKNMTTGQPLVIELSNNVKQRISASWNDKLPQWNFGKSGNPEEYS